MSKTGNEEAEQNSLLSGPGRAAVKSIHLYAVATFASDTRPRVYRHHRTAYLCKEDQ